VIEAAAVAAALDEVRDRIATAGDLGAVRVVAVTKGFGADAVQAAVAAGLLDVGENYAQELAHKWESTDGAGAAWHFLGALQRNKVARLAPFVDCWQSVARREEGVQIARHRPGAAVLVQVRTWDAPQRNGVAEPEVAPLVAALGDLGLDVRGLMAVAPPDPAAASASFARVVALADRLGLPERSIGMTEDLEAAVACGSTMVRIGRALFGPRPGPAG
jgi:pyridoxal phosphate enzyme (YggS family)